MQNPEIFVVAGPNGAGKSTGAAGILPKRFPTDIERRYWRAINNLFKLYLPLANRWALCDNSGKKLFVVGRGRMGEEPTIYDPQRFDRIRRAAGQD